jgi:3-hydroxybutyryl-CoA dehydrogenase
MSESTKVAVLGAGTMGHGIAQVCAAAGFTVHVSDPSEAARAKGIEGVRASLDRMVAKAKMTAAQRDEVLGRIAWGGDLGAAVDGAGVVIEAVPERIELKRDLLQRVDALAPDTALLGSNTSSLSITELGGRLGAAERTVGLHFFNPVPVMELVEVVRGLKTSAETVERALDFAKSLGKTPIVVNDVPGFATSRLGVILGVEAMRMVEQGVASVADIDRGMELGYRHPMGPLKLTDLVGLDVRLAILEHLHREVGDQFRPPPLLRQMVRAGKLGKKSGEGFYRWENGQVVG